jgi:hypothetical protein
VKSRPITYVNWIFPSTRGEIRWSVRHRTQRELNWAPGNCLNILISCVSRRLSWEITIWAHDLNSFWAQREMFGCAGSHSNSFHELQLTMSGRYDCCGGFGTLQMFALSAITWGSVWSSRKANSQKIGTAISFLFFAAFPRFLLLKKERHMVSVKIKIRVVFCQQKDF